LHAPHGQAGHGAMRLIGEGAEIRIHKWDHILDFGGVVACL
jgi:hypothetical protein